MAIVSKKVFLSSSAFIALVDRAHPRHAQADAYFRYFGQHSYQLYTGYFNLIEAYTYIFKNISPSLARDFMRAVSLGSINVIYPDQSIMNASIKTLIRAQSNELKFEDAQMEVMAYKNGIPQILTFDYLPPLFGLTTFSLPL